MGTPVFFRQMRPGLHGEPLELVKFRTMRDVADGTADSADTDRITRLGRVLRAASIDELPELWNVAPRRDEPRGAASAVDVLPTPVLGGPAAPARGQPRHYRPGTGQGPELVVLGEVCDRTCGWSTIEASVSMPDPRPHLSHVFRRAGVNARGDDTMPRFTGSVRPVNG